MQIITYLIGAFMVLLISFPVVVKQYYISKTRGKILVRVIGAHEEESPCLLKVLGAQTEPNDKGKAYIITPKHINKKTNEISGSTFETWYPQGLPRFLQVRIRAMQAVEGNPKGVDFYGEIGKIPVMTDTEVGTLHREKFSEMAAKLSEGTDEFFKKWKEIVKPGANKTVVYIMLGIAIVGIVAIGYLTFMNGQAIGQLRWW